MPADALFLPDGDATFVPTSGAVGPWDARIVHGAAVVALLTGRLTPAEGTMARVTVDFLRPVPMGPLDLDLADLGGGTRAQRHRAVLTSDGQEVAAAESVVLRAGALELPDDVVVIDPAHRAVLMASARAAPNSCRQCRATRLTAARWGLKRAL